MKTNNRRLCIIVTAEVTATTFLAGYLGYLRSAGWEVTLVTASSGGLHEFARKEKIQAVHVNMTREPSPIRDLVSIVRLARIINRLQPGIVVGATPKAGLLAMVTARIARVPVRVYLLWGIRFETASGISRQILKAAEKVSIGNASHVIANSHSLAAAAKKLGILGEKDAHVIGAGSSHGVDTTRFRQLAPMGGVSDDAEAFLSNRTPQTIVIGFVGRIHPDKGIETLLSGVRLAASDGVPYKLLFVGTVEDAHTAQSIRRSGLDYLIVGAVSDVRPYILATDIHCLPSRREGFPNVVLEAGALGRVSIVSNATGAIDSVVNGSTGLLFETDNVNSLAAAITRLAGSKQLREEMGKNARSFVIDNFQQTKVWEQNECYLKQIVQEASRMTGSQAIRWRSANR